MVSTLVILSALALFSSAQATTAPFSWLKKDFARDVVAAGRRLEGHTGGGDAPAMDMAGCEKECPGFLKMLMEVGPKLTVDEKDPDYADKMEKAIKEHVCPRKAEAECPMKKCDEGTKVLMGSLACACACDGLMGMEGAMKDMKNNCAMIGKVTKCIESAADCEIIEQMGKADPGADAAEKAFYDACPDQKPGASSSSSFASKRCAVGAGLAAMFTAAVKEL